MNEDTTGGGGCSILIMAAVALLAAFVIFGAGAAAVGDTPSSSPSRTETNVLSRNELMSRNEVNILSPTINTYYNSGDTSQVVSGDRNQVGPVQTGGGQCWLSSSQAWGNCPAGVPAGAAVP